MVNEDSLIPSSQVPFLHGNGRSGHLKDASTEPSGGGSRGKVQRRSAKVAAYYLHELANEELVKEWPKRKVLQDLVPDDRKVHDCLDWFIHIRVLPVCRHLMNDILQEQ